VTLVETIIYHCHIHGQSIVAAIDKEVMKKAIKDIGNKFAIRSSLSVEDFLDVHIVLDEQCASVEFTQPQLIKSIIRDLGLDDKSNTLRTPALGKVVLHAHVGSAPHNESWQYRLTIGKLNYLEKSTCMLFINTHDSVRILKLSIWQQLKELEDTYWETSTKGSRVYQYLGDWDKERASDDPITARSRTGYIIMHANCPIIWASKLCRQKQLTVPLRQST
jgi:hypothetical protein